MRDVDKTSQRRCLFTLVGVTSVAYRHDVKRESWTFWLFHNYVKSDLNRFKPASIFLLLIVPSRYFCGASFCFMSWCLIFLCCWRLMYVIIFLVKLR